MEILNFHRYDDGNGLFCMSCCVFRAYIRFVLKCCCLRCSELYSIKNRGKNWPVLKLLLYDVRKMGGEGVVSFFFCIFSRVFFLYRIRV